ncbi:dTDP-4-dehydrorhamnose reductase [Shewanella corallii]|uniref:dTDP-4-dehydrorhamnose reductase n=1 Tax=Shewanella corallii TaxID=560080 RepID=A0ABT0N973_9GAMM|nr:dTDP-4-dehydrorhamnose reductase [Shewanella corallii]MCL2914925.1 dTDP-4-dehydrorhamnose reductase [Shewanella corallii]
MSLRIAVIGRHGQLANSLRKTQPSHTSCLYVGRDEIDLFNLAELEKSLAGIDIVINTAAYTAVDQAETDKDDADALNHIAAMNLAQTGKIVGYRLIHLSTDYVFSGIPGKPWTTIDTPEPLSVYGKSKYAGEQAVIRSGVKAAIIRTSWLYSDTGCNFVNTMLRLLNNKDSLSVVNDQFGSPTSATNLSAFIWAICQIAHWPQIIHFRDQGVATWFEFAQEIQRQASKIGILDSHCTLVPISTEEYGAPAPRPLNSVLDMSDTPRLMEQHRWQFALSEVLHKIKRRGEG